MGTATANVNFYIDKDLKENADQLFSELGINMNTALNLFLHHSVKEGRLPFEVTDEKPNEVTMAAIEEGRRLVADKNAHGYHDIASLREALEV